MSDIEIRQSDEINLLDVIIILVKYKRLVFGLPIIAGILTVLLAFLLPPVYTSTTQILPPQQGPSLSDVVFSTLGISSTGSSSLGAALGLRDPNEQYIGMLQSQTIENNLVTRFDLQTYYNKPLLSEARRAFERDTDIISDKKSGLIIINVDNKSPEKAAEIANAYIDELEKMMNALAITEAAKRRLFFEQQLKDAMEKLDQAELAARTAIENGGISKADAQGEAVVETTTQLRAQIAAKEIEIDAMRNYAAARNPDLLRAQHEVGAMRQELAKLEGRDAYGNNLKEKSSGDVGADNLALLRNVKYYETLVSLLSQQFAMAKIDEAHNAAIIQVVDKAIPSDRPSRPWPIIIIATMLMVFVFTTVIMLYREASLRNPQALMRLAELKVYLKK